MNESITSSLSSSSLLPTSLSWIEIFFGVLVAPISTFQYLRDQCQLNSREILGALFIVFLAVATNATCLMTDGAWESLTFNIYLEIILGLLAWGFSVTCLSCTAIAFNIDMARIRASIVTLGWSLLPWLLIAPISCFQPALGQGSFFLLVLLILVWSWFLQIIAIKQSYGLRNRQILILIFLVPWLLFCLQTVQATQALVAIFNAFN